MSEVCPGRQKIPAWPFPATVPVPASFAKTFAHSLRCFCRRIALMSGILATLGSLAPTTACAQQMDPRSYANVPIDLNFLLAGYAYSWGDVVFDPSVPVTNADAKVNAVYFGYIRSLDFWGQSGTLGLVLPYAYGLRPRRCGGADEQRRPLRRRRPDSASGSQSVRRACPFVTRVPQLSAGSHRRSQPAGNCPNRALLSRTKSSTSAPTGGRSSRRSVSRKRWGTGPWKAHWASRSIPTTTSSIQATACVSRIRSMRRKLT